MVPARVVAVPTHGRPVVMNFSIVFMQISMIFRQNTPETAQKCSNGSMSILEDLSFAHTATIRHPRAPQPCRAGSSLSKCFNSDQTRDTAAKSDGHDTTWPPGS